MNLWPVLAISLSTFVVGTISLVVPRLVPTSTVLTETSARVLTSVSLVLTTATIVLLNT